MVALRVSTIGIILKAVSMFMMRVASIILRYFYL